MKAGLPCGAVGAETLDDIGAGLRNDFDVGRKDDDDQKNQCKNHKNDG